MLRSIRVLSCNLFLTILSAFAGASSWEPMMRDRIQKVVQKFQATVSLYAKNLDTGSNFGIRESERVRTASTIKLPIMVAVFAEVDRGRASWTETLALRESDKVSGSGVVRELSEGVALPVRDLMRLMIVVSDNTATNLLLDRFSADLVNAEMEKLGLRNCATGHILDTLAWILA